MRLRLVTIVESDDGKVSRTADNTLTLATDLPGVDVSVQKQEFLTQAENLVRSVSENQIPALYAGVAEELVRPGVGTETKEPVLTAAQASVRGKLKAMKERKVTEDDLVQDDLPGTEQSATDQLKGQV